MPPLVSFVDQTRSPQCNLMVGSTKMPHCVFAFFLTKFCALILTRQEFWLCEIIRDASGQRHSATSVVVSFYFMFSKRTLGKILKNGINRRCFHVCFKSLLQDYGDTRLFLHKPLSTSTGMNHKCFNYSTTIAKMFVF